MLVTVGDTDGFCTVDVKPAGPDHDQPVVAALVLALRLAVPPTHIGPSLVGPEDTGTGFTDTNVVKLLLQPDAAVPFVTVMV